MKARLCLAASLLLLAAPAFAQETPQQTDPSAQTSPSPSDMPTEAAPPAPASEPVGEPATQAAPAAGAPAMLVVTDLSEVEDDGKLVQPWGVTVDSVEEMDVYDANGKQIGEVDAVLQDKNGEIKGVAIEYGGFLGFGEKGAVVTLDQLKLKDGTLVTDINEEQLPQQPEWTK